MAITKYKGRTLGSALLEGLQGYQAAKNQKEDSFYKNLDAQIKMADLQTKGFVPEMQETPRRVLGLPMGSRKTLAFRYDPTMNADYQKQQLELQKLQREQQEAEDIAPLRRKAIADYTSGGSGGGVSPSGRMFDPFSGKMINDPRAPNALDPLDRELKENKLKSLQSADRKKIDLLRASAEDNLKTIEEIKKGMDYFGPLGDLPTELAPSTYTSLGMDYGKRKNWEANISKLLSQRVLDKMNELKQASRTGATGFGALNQDELKKLSDASTALQRGLSKEDAIRYLNDIELMHKKILAGNGESGSIPEFASESDIPEGFKGPAIVNGVEGTVV